MSPLIACPNCRAWLLEGVFNRPDLTPCPSCGTPVRIEAFPALFREKTVGQSAQPVMVEGESSCFFHPQKKAVVPCSSCGRFLCTLCDCEFDHEHFCPNCLDSGKSKGKIKALDTQRTRYDHIALALALWPIIVFYFTIITAPMALFVTIRYWNSPRSPVQRNRLHFIFAAVIALLEIGCWATFFIVISTRRS